MIDANAMFSNLASVKKVKVSDSMFPPDTSDDVDQSAAASKDGQPAAAESGPFTN